MLLQQIRVLFEWVKIWSAARSISQFAMLLISTIKPSEAWGCAKIRVFPITCCSNRSTPVREIGTWYQLPVVIEEKHDGYKNPGFRSKVTFRLQVLVLQYPVCRVLFRRRVFVRWHSGFLVEYFAALSFFVIRTVVMVLVGQRFSLYYSGVYII